MTIRLYPQHYNADATATCGDCRHECRAGNCEPIRDPSERLCSGDPLPAGECPECGALSYVPDREEEVTHKYKVAAVPVTDLLHSLDCDVAGVYFFDAVGSEEALDQFHGTVPIKVLEDFEIDVEIDG